MKIIPLETVCPFCGAKQALTAGVDHDLSPEDGNASICAKCYQVSLFDKSRRGNLRMPSETEGAEIRDDWTIQKARLMLRTTQ